MPLIETSRKTAEVSAIDSALEKSGYKEKALAKREAAEILNSTGGDLNSTLGIMVQLMQAADNDSVRLKAVENSLAIHGISLKEDQQSAGNNVMIVINDKDTNAAEKLDAILCPDRTEVG